MKKKINIAGLALFAVFAFGAIVAVSAFATSPEWLVDGAAIALGTTFHVEQSGALLFADLKGDLQTECEYNGLGAAGADQTDLTETAGLTNCKLDVGTFCDSIIIKPVHLPWLTELLGVVSDPTDMIVNGGSGMPGWTVTCEGIIADECTSEAVEPLIENMQAGPGATELTTDVLAIFNQGSIAECTFGGANSGEVSGELLFFALENLSLEVS